MRKHGALGFGLCAAGVGNLHDIFRADFHLWFVVGHGLHFRNQIEEPVRDHGITQGNETPFLDCCEFVLVPGDYRVQGIFYDEHPRAGMIDNETDFLGVEHIVDRYLDGANFSQTDHADGVVVRVVGIDCHPVTFFNSITGHKVGKTPGLAFKIIERNFQITKDDGRLIAVFCCGSACHITDGIAVNDVAHMSYPLVFEYI